MASLGPARVCCCGRRPASRWPWGWLLPPRPPGALLPALAVLLSLLLLPRPSHSTALGEEDGVAEAPPAPSLPPTVIRTRVINTKYGRLQGFVSHASGPHGAIPASTSPATQDSEGGTRHRKPVDVFLGIPYATPPVRSNRFGPTRTPVPWDGLRPADRLSPVCPQHFPDEVLAVSRALEASSPAASAAAEAEALRRMPRGRLESLKRLLPHLRRQSEDCLYLNVYAPAQVAPPEALERYPVLVFVHGESFSWNSGNPYDGSILASYADLVVVTLNYRLGVLGFLNANAAPHLRARVANYGLMDQIAALHWIQNNIALFGGDPTNVTLFGHGTGAACVNLLMVSPTVMPGLFHRAALLSGSALSSWAIVEDPVFYAVRLARRLNCSSPEEAAPTATGAAPSGAAAAAEAWREAERLEDCLRAAPLSALTAQDAPPPPPAFLTAFGPSVDGVVVRPGFRADMAAALLASGGGGGGAGVDGDSGECR
ncbi:neuroligin 4-like [Hetaerina americana]|uniref:neuroligin 4-like n=1 Tax=Hetaerina americana TaxID=62018 RepID=UPI003A7F4E8E